MELITVKYVVDDSAVLKAQKSVAGLTEEELKLLAALRDVETATKNVDATQEKQQRKVSDLEKAFGKLGQQIVAAFSVAAVVQFEKEIIKITSEFQKYQAVLTNLLGSQQAADAAMASIATTAAKTNFSVQEITETYIKFANRGLKLTEEEIMNLADVTNASGKSIDQFTEAVLDAMTGENERLKEFGIQAQKHGQTTEFTFKGVKTAVDNSAESIKNYLVGLGELEGVTGATAAISGTLSGKISNVNDSWNQLLLTIGQKQSGVLYKAIQGIDGAIQYLNKALKDPDQKYKEQKASQLQTDKEFMEDALTARKELYSEVYKLKLTEEEATKKAIKDQRAWLDFEESATKLRSANDREDTESKKDALRKITRDREVLAIIEKEYTEKFLKNAHERIEAARKEAAERAKFFAQKMKEDDWDSQTLNRQTKEYESKNKARINAKLEEQIFIHNANLEMADDEQELNAETQRLEDENREKSWERIKKNSDQQLTLGDILARKDTENWKDRKKSAQETNLAIQTSYKVLGEFMSAHYDNERQRMQDRQAELQQQQQLELALYEGNAIAQTAIRQKFEQEQRKLKQEQAKRDREQAIFNILINTAMGITAALASVPPNVPLSIAVGVIGAAQFAAVASKPLPKFKTGTKSVPGHDTGDDSVLAMLRPGEAVVPVAQNQKYKKFVSGIIDDNLFEILPSLQPDVNVVKTLVSNYNTNQSDLAVSELKKLNTKMDNLRVTEINIDKKGIQVLQKSLTAEEEVVNRYYFQ